MVELSVIVIIHSGGVELCSVRVWFQNLVFDECAVAKNKAKLFK